MSDARLDDYVGILGIDKEKRIYSAMRAARPARPARPAAAAVRSAPLPELVVDGELDEDRALALEALASLAVDMSEAMEDAAEVICPLDIRYQRHRIHTEDMALSAVPLRLAELLTASPEDEAPATPMVLLEAASELDGKAVV